MARFAPDTGMLQFIESMRYKDSSSDNKTLWLNEALEWNAINGNTVLTVAAVTWFDEGAPWAVFTVEEVIYNMDVAEYIKARGL